jgi:hypothetical protein
MRLGQEVAMTVEEVRDRGFEAREYEEAPVSLRGLLDLYAAMGDPWLFETTGIAWRTEEGTP